MKTENVNRILASTPRIYNKIAGDFSDTRGVSWEGFGEFTKYAKEGDKILDLGCGNGRTAQLFESLKINYLGLDNSQELIEIAQYKYRDRSGYKFEVADALDLHLEPNQFDLVLMIAMLHHIPIRAYRMKILQDVFVSMKSGARLVMSNWNLWKINGRKPFRYYPYLFNYAEKSKFGAYDISDAFVPWKANLRQSEWQSRYVHSFTANEMRSLLKEAGFAIDYVRYASKSKGKAAIFTGDNLLAVAVKK